MVSYLVICSHTTHVKLFSLALLISIRDHAVAIMAEHDDSIVACGLCLGMGFVGFESMVERTAVLELRVPRYYLLFVIHLDN